MIPHIDTGTCTGCGTCAAVCPPRAIVINEGTACIEEEFCEECGFCAAACPLDAITIPFPVHDR